MSVTRWPLICFVVLWSSSTLSATVREQEAAECRPGEIVTWEDGKDQRAIASSFDFMYRHRGAPAGFSVELVESKIIKAIASWEACGIPVKFVSGERSPGPNTVWVDWSDAGSRGNFGLANLTQRTLSLGASAFELLRQRNPQHDATQTLQMVISHEMGHFLGLVAHSRRCIDVLSYYHDGKGQRCVSRDPAGMKPGVDYRHVLPTSCDIERCRAINGFPASRSFRAE